MKSKKVLSMFCLLAGILLVAAALALHFYNEQESSQSENEKNEILGKMQELQGDSTGSVNDSRDNIYPMEIENARVEMTEVEIDGYSYIGRLLFPTLNDEFPIMSGWDMDRLKIAPCRYYGSVFTDDLVIAGHNYRKGFGKLKQLKIGDEVDFEDMDGNLHRYTVDATEVLEPTDIDGCVNSPWEMTLYTCTYEGKQRFAVRLKEMK